MRITREQRKMLRENNSAKTWRLLPKEVQTLIIASFFVAMGYGVIVPAIPLYSRSFGVSAAAVGFVVSAFAPVPTGYEIQVSFIKLQFNIGPK